MKTLKAIIVFGLIALLMSSCAHRTYPVQSMYNYYHARMKTSEELEIKGKILIFFSEKDITSEYDIISLNAYKPFTLLPFKRIQEKKLNKKFLKEAVIKAYDEGGNAILVRGGGLFAVLDLKSWDADSAKAANLVNPIFDMKLADVVKSGKLFNMKRSERVRTENMFIEQIDVNLDNVTTLEELEAVRVKIQVLAKYNSCWKHPNNKIQKKVKRFNTRCKYKEKRIPRMAEKAALAKQKEAEKAAVAKQKEAEKAAIAKQKEEEAAALAAQLAQEENERKQQYDQLSKEEQYALSVDSITFYSGLIYKVVRRGKYIRAFDLNDDGTVDESELKIIESWAANCDVNHDGVWNEDENAKLREMMKKNKKSYEK